MTRSPTRRGRLRRLAAIAVVLALVTATVASVAIATDAFGAGERWDALLAKVDRFLAGPVPQRHTLSTVRVTPPPSIEPSLSPATPDPSGHVPTQAPTAKPKRIPVDVDIATAPAKVFKTELHKDWCAVAGVQMVLAELGLADTSDATQNKLAARIREWDSYDDSHNGDWGPAAMALALEAYGAPGYEIRAFEGRNEALVDAARAIEATGSPAILLAWRGAHTWVMTGFRADADPAVFDRNVHISGTYILDPWFPRISSIWGASDPPGTFQDKPEMERNFLPWKRPEGNYPDRDGLFITVVPTLPAPTAG